MKAAIALLFPAAGLAAAVATICPTITRTACGPGCPRPVMPHHSTISVPCGCPAGPMPERTVSLDCAKPHMGGCYDFDYTVVHPASCPSSTRTKPPPPPPTSTSTAPLSSPTDSSASSTSKTLTHIVPPPFTSLTLTLTPSTTPTSSPAPSCPTITSTYYDLACGAYATDPAAHICITPDCILDRIVTVPCACVPDLPLVTTTVTACGCQTGCGTATMLEYLPCPVTVGPVE